jgi:cobalt-zinc-cadmium efflux system membrane fusion protein
MLGNDPRIFSPLFVVTDPTRLWLQLDVTESDLGSLQQGQALRVFNKAFPNRSFKGRIELIGSAFDPATRTVKMRAVVENPEMLLKAEMYVTAELALDVADKSGSGAEVDRSAVFMKDNQRFLFVEESPGHFVRRVVVSDGESNGRIRIKGLATGQRVVMEGCLLLQALMDAAPDKS